MAKKLFLLSLVSLLMAVFSLQTALAYNPNWKADQAKMFEQIKLKPGDVIDSTNWQQVQNLLPESIVGYIKKGEFVLNIGEFKYDYSMEEAWEKATETNRGKYSLGGRKEIIESATGSFPKYLYGRPFPDLDKNDPDLGAKIMHNKTVDTGRTGNLNNFSPTLFLGEGGLERVLFNEIWFYCYWAHPKGEQPNPNSYKYLDLFKIYEPYDLANTIVLTLRPLNGSPDLGGTYVPALRRVRRTSGSNRSDPFFGSDIVVDDTYGWGGQNETMSWKVIGEKIALIPKARWQTETPDTYIKQSNGSWKGSKGSGIQKYGCEDKDWKGATWAPLHALWVPRKVYLIEATPLDPYYNYGKCIYYVDQEVPIPCIKIVTNRAGEHWKTVLVDTFMQKWGDDSKMTDGGWGWYLVIDDRTHHSTAAPGRSIWGKWDLDTTVMDPNIKPEMFTFEKMATMSK